MKTIEIPTNPDQFFSWLKTESEKYWEKIKIHKATYGFQIQPGTTWLPGLTDAQIAQYEKDMGFAFPNIYKTYLKHMNGTEQETLNVYGNSGEPYGYGIGYYSYPRDLAAVKDMIAWILEEYKIKPEDIDKQGIPHIMPIVSHRFLVIDRCEANPMLSMYGNDSILYADSLDNFLVDDIFSKRRQQHGLADVEVKFWLDESLI